VPSYFSGVPALRSVRNSAEAAQGILLQHAPDDIWVEGCQLLQQLSNSAEAKAHNEPLLLPCASMEDIATTLDVLLLGALFSPSECKLTEVYSMYSHSVLQHYISKSRLPCAREMFQLRESFRSVRVT
jgi:hypothetical protein